MSDYIPRAAVEEVLEKAQIISDGENCGYCTQDVNITAIPAADVAPVVRCKDCVYADTNPRRENQRWCKAHMEMVYENEFCSRGERESE